MKTNIDQLTIGLADLRAAAAAAKVTDSDFTVGAGLIQTGLEKIGAVQARLQNKVADLKKKADDAAAAAAKAKADADAAEAAEAAAAQAAQ